MKRRAILMMVSILIVIVAIAQVSITVMARDTELCFRPQTQHCISGSIRTYWEGNGGLEVFGYPITSLRTETIEGTWTGPTQWFERDRLEDHGVEGVLGGRLGARLLELRRTRWEDFPKVNGAPFHCVYFAQTGHSLCEPFLSYWQQHGSLALFGYPISERFSETIDTWTGIIQYFERRRMEHHTELAGTRYEVLLGRLGNEVVAAQQPTILPILPTTRPGATLTPTLIPTSVRPQVTPKPTERPRPTVPPAPIIPRK